jgi:thiamine-phosphate pyrophosphorylase
MTARLSDSTELVEVSPKSNDKLMNNKIFRILDANINRAMEGLRVVEEVFRFILEDKKATLKLKSLRNELKRAIEKLPREALLKARDSLSDVGGKLYTREEASRSNIGSIFKSNIKRVEEAVRVLEEFSKMIKPALGKKFKAVRFKLYAVEKIYAKIGQEGELYGKNT